MQFEIIDEGAKMADDLELGCCSLDISFRVPYRADE